MIGIIAVIVGVALGVVPVQDPPPVVEAQTTTDCPTGEHKHVTASDTSGTTCHSTATVHCPDGEHEHFHWVPSGDPGLGYNVWQNCHPTVDSWEHCGYGEYNHEDLTCHDDNNGLPHRRAQTRNSFGYVRHDVPFHCNGALPGRRARALPLGAVRRPRPRLQRVAELPPHS